MSITYPEVQPSAHAKKTGGASVMNTGSALFPSGSASVYERASKVRSSKNMSMAWIAAPVAVVLIGGGVYLAMTHQPAAHPAPAVVSRASTTIATPSPAPVAHAVKATPATPVGATQSSHVTHTQSVVRTTVPVDARASAHRVTRSTTVSNSTTSTPVAAPTAVSPTVTSAAPTPGTFSFTPSAPAQAQSTDALSTTPDTVTPQAAPSSTAQPAPQSTPQG